MATPTGVKPTGVTPLLSRNRVPRDIRTPLRAARRELPKPGPIARRRFAVQLAKRVLPIGAVLLLAAIVLWPELSRELNRHRAALIHPETIPASGEMATASYHGVDQRGRPYAITATTAHDEGTGRVDLTQPKGDITTDGGRWLLVQSRHGAYVQHTGALDLSGDVLVYRDDGTTLQTDTADVDLKAGAASSNDRTHVEGPVGQLDAQGFMMLDRGDLIRFTGPGHMIMRAGHAPAPTPTLTPAPTPAVEGRVAR